MGARQKVTVRLSRKDIKATRKLFRGGSLPVRVIQRARTLLLLHGGQTAPKVAESVGYSAPAVQKIARRYKAGGLVRALYDSPRPGVKPALDASQKQRIIAMVCSDPPAGRARWSVRLITEEAIQRELVPKVGRETIRLLLLHHDFKPWREKNVVCGGSG